MSTALVGAADEKAGEERSLTMRTKAIRASLRQGESFDKEDVMFSRTPIRGIFCVAVLGLAMQLSAAPAIAQVRAALTKNVDEPGRMPFQQSTIVNTSTCTFNSVLYFCEITFPVVPAGKRLILQHTSVFMALTATGSPDSVRFLDRLHGTAAWVQPTFTTRANTTTHFFLDREVLVYYEPGDTPTMLLAMTTPPAAIEVTLHGYFIDASN